jgi:L-2-hydroxyglutarate oxidase LhgO
MIVHDVVVIGGGIVGLSTALQIVRAGPGNRLVVLEKEAAVATHQSGRNSGVIHSGVYYRPGSLKARLCVEGAAAMLEFCRDHGVPHAVRGKVVVATREADLPRLQELHWRGTANGVAGLALVGPDRLRDLEPAARGLRALHVPGVSVTDFAEAARAMAWLAGAAGASLVTGARVTGLHRRGSITVVESTAGDFGTRLVVNCAGLHSDRIARLAGADDGTIIVPFRGEYRVLRPERRDLVRGLIYPVPDPRFPFLDIHLTRTVHDVVEAGPNAVLALAREGYTAVRLDLADLVTTFTHPGFWRLAARHWRRGAAEMHRSWSAAAFLRQAQDLVPALSAGDLTPGGAGVRAQAVDRTGLLLDDFHIVRRAGAIHVINAPSPAATAAIPIGRAIALLAVEALA